MTDHAAEAERFHNEYLRLRTPGRVPKLADVLALANYHATMAVVDAIRGLAPNTAQDATGGDRTAPQPERGQVDTPAATDAAQGNMGRNDITCADCSISLPDMPEWERQLFGPDEYRCDGCNRAAAWRAHAEKAEAERDAMQRAWDSLTAELRLSRFAALRDLADRHTPEG